MRASGKVLLAFGHEDAVRRLADSDGSLPRRTEHTLLTLSDFEHSLAHTQEREYAIDSQEYALGVCGLAIPLFEWPRVALSTTAPLSRFNNPEPYLAAILEAKDVDSQFH